MPVASRAASSTSSPRRCSRRSRWGHLGRGLELEVHGRARRITIDLDPTDDPTHDQQELSFFNGHYDTYCYIPLIAATLVMMAWDEER